MAIVVVAIVMAAHFSSDSRRDTSQPNNQTNDLRGGDDTYLSVYEKINISTQDTHRGSFYEQAENSDDEVKVVDVEPYGDGSIAKEFAIEEQKLAQMQVESKQISQEIEHGVSIDFVRADNLEDNFEHLYEEALPEDIFEPQATIKNKKMQKLQIMPEHKPAYFGKTPMIAIVIDDMGINRKRTADISSLPYPLTASFLTYGHNINAQVDKSIASGQEIMLHAPMEAIGKVDNAPDVLTTTMSIDEIKDNLQVMLRKVKNIKGINNHMGSKLTQDKERMSAVMEVLKKHNLFFLDSKTSAQSQADAAAKEMKVKHVSRNVFLDNNNDKDYILRQLALTERLARKNGYAIAIGHPKSNTFLALQEWLPTLQKNNLQLVPLSKIVDILNR